jgi:pyruvate kinase
LAALITAGVDVFRLNMAHGTPKEQEVRLAAIRRASERLGQPVALLVDLAGPKIRLGELPGGQLQCGPNDRVRFVRTAAAQKEVANNVGSPSAGQSSAIAELTATYAPLVDELAVGDRIMLADGIVSLVVERVTPDYAECRVIQPGLVRSRQGVNLPGVKLSVPAMSDVDRANAVWAARQEIDFISLSFVRTAEDIRQLKALLAAEKAAQAQGAGAAGAVPPPLPAAFEDRPQVIAKIEKPEALAQLGAIVAEADGVMVARGDLGVEIDIAQVAVAQKEIVAECQRQRKPVIIATQMLDSMQHSRIPTRAEVADVANAILDGTDACMLSGETAVGEYPREAVEMMHRVALATEPMGRKDQGRGRASAARTVEGPGAFAQATPAGLNTITESTVCAAGRLAESLDAKLIVVASASGATALSLAKHHFFVPTVGVSDSPATLRRMCLYWGMIPLPGAPVHDNAAVLRHVVEWGKAGGMLAAGDRVVLIAGTGLEHTAHNAIVVHQVS